MLRPNTAVMHTFIFGAKYKVAESLNRRILKTKRQKYEQNTVIRRAFRLGKVSDKGMFSPRIYTSCTVSTS